MLQLASKVTLVSNCAYNNDVMQIRNIYMVAMADQVVALWNGTPGGTYNAIKYALEVGKLVHVIEPFTWKEYDLTSKDLDAVKNLGSMNRTLSNSEVKAQFNGIKVYLQTDGSCAPNPGPGGWSFKLVYKVNGKDHTVFGDGYSVASTNNIMEMTAILEGFKKIATIPELQSKEVLITVKADSKYCIDTLDDWMEKWKVNAIDGPDGKKIWRTAQKANVSNQDIWENIDAERQKYTCLYQYIPREQNSELDARAKAQTEIAKQIIAAAAATAKTTK
jgi:ribonuclease HI